MDGIIASSLAEDDPLLQTMVDRRLPLVIVDQPEPAHLATMGAAGTPWIGIDDRGAASGLAEHVLLLGHRNLGVVSFALQRGASTRFASIPDQERATLSVTKNRLAGYRDAVGGTASTGPACPFLRAATALRQKVRRAPWPCSPPLPDRPLLCLGDRLAQGALVAAETLGLRVPEDLSIVGFDDALSWPKDSASPPCGSPAGLRANMRRADSST